jgi:predicted RNA methylase
MNRQDVSLLDYRAPLLAANLVSAHFPGERGAALVLDVACGTGLVAAEVRTDLGWCEPTAFNICRHSMWKLLSVALLLADEEARVWTSCWP